MWTALIIIAVVTYVWFFFTNRKATMEVTGIAVGSTAATLGVTAKYISAEAKAAKAKNDYEAVISGKVYDTSVKSHFHKTAKALDEEFGYINAVNNAKAEEAKYKDALAKFHADLASKGIA